MKTLGGSKRGRLRAAAVIGGVLLFQPGAVPAHATVVAGVCDLTIEVDFTPDLTLTSATTVTLTLDGTGTCLTNNAMTYDAELTGTLTIESTVPAHYLCVGGVATGTASLSLIDHPTFGDAQGEAVAIGTAAAAELTIVGGTTFAASGAFVADPGDAGACATGTLASTTWEGELVFEDPVLTSRS